jgi:hypothetical protein
MSELHGILWSVCRKLPTDFEPYGERNRDIAEPGEDCSCGCVHFVQLAGGLGNDWGICINPKSPRAGLLTFEHQGCPEFQSYSTVKPAPEDPLAAESQEERSPAKKVKVDFNDVQMALEGFDSVSGEQVRHFLDIESGEVLVLCRDWEDYEELCERIDAGLADRYLRIDRLDSHESFRTMEDFAHGVVQPGIKHRLLDALSQSKPFRRFKDALHSELSLRDAWFKFRDAAMERHVRNWLRARNIDVEWIGAKRSID